MGKHEEPKRLSLVALVLRAGTATQDITVSLLQAKTNAGGSSKALSTKEIWYKRGGATFTNSNSALRDVFTKSPYASRESVQSSYATATDRVATTNHFLAAIRINPKDLDNANGLSTLASRLMLQQRLSLASVSGFLRIRRTLVPISQAFWFSPEA